MLHREVHNDVYKVIKHWVGTTDSAEKLLDIWTSFVETFFGLPLRPKEEQVCKGHLPQAKAMAFGPHEALVAAATEEFTHVPLQLDFICRAFM